MKTGAKLVRESDKKVFTVKLLSHWSDIQAEDGEKDAVKWAFDNYYVSGKGATFKGYHLQEDEPVSYPDPEADERIG